jgi:hypothetical protein
MSSYKDKLEKALNNKKLITEAGIKYEDGHSERMHPNLERDLKDRKHSLGNHPAFPSSDESTFEQKLISKRYNDVMKSVKRNFGTDSINTQELMGEMFNMINGTMKIEGQHKAQLEKMAVDMVRKEFDMSENDVDVVAELVPQITITGTIQNPTPQTVDDMDFDSHEDIEKASDEVYKRRFLNSMIQGSAKKSTHMFHMVDDELTNIDPRLPNLYGKMMSAADYAYYVFDTISNATKGGMVKVDFPKTENDKPKIHAQAMVFPVLIHELVKGAMELLSSHGLPENPKLRNYVINKADFLEAEPWDMRLGVGIWEKLVDALPDEHFDMRHHVYMELAALPVKEFNGIMKEIMAGTKKGKEYIADIVKDIIKEIKEDEYNDSVNNMYKDGDGYSPDDLDNINIDDLFK